MTNDEILRADEDDRRDWLADGAARALSETDDDQRCQEPHSVWGTCGIPESAHDDALEQLRGTRFYHSFKGS